MVHVCGTLNWRILSLDVIGDMGILRECVCFNTTVSNDISRWSVFIWTKQDNMEKTIDLQVTDTLYHNMLYRVQRATGKVWNWRFGLETPMIVFSSFNLPCLSMVNHGFNFNLFTFGSNIRKDLFQIRLLLAINRCENVY